MAKLKQLGLDQNTLLVFTSDNGGTQQSSQEPLRGNKGCYYEGGIREPFIVRWPGHIPAGKVDEITVCGAVDLLPSLCAIAGSALPQGAVLDGENLSAAWFGQPTVRAQPLFWEYGRNATFKYPPGRDRSPNLAVREDE